MGFKLSKSKRPFKLSIDEKKTASSEHKRFIYIYI